MREYYESCCYQVVNYKEKYEMQRAKFFHCAEQLKTSDFWMSNISSIAEEMRVAYTEYNTIRFQVHQMIWATGNEEYKEIYNEIVGEEECESQQ